MALLIKRLMEAYTQGINDKSDPRADGLFLMSSPLPLFGIIGIWFMFVFKWGPAYMKDKEPWNLKRIMMVYNVVQVIVNLYIVYYVWLARDVISWRCSEVDYSRSYWGMKFFNLSYIYFMLKLADLMDTVFFVLRKKTGHLSFLHVYHHFGMAFLGWIAVKFIGGGHGYFIALANCIVHSILYSYYLLTAYDSKYSKLLWLKKFITQAQLLQFVFLLIMFIQLPFVPDCKYPKLALFFFFPQNFFMIILFSDFYVRTYYLAPRRQRKELEEKRKLQELQEQRNRSGQEIKDPRVEGYFLMSSPLPLMGILALWGMFIFKWGPEYMKDREPWNLKHIMIVYNIGQVIVNVYIVYFAWLARDIINWRCSEVDYSTSYWGLMFLKLAHVYFLLKVADLIDTVFFVLRKKTGHLSFLHIYHHFGMTWITWIGVKFIGGGHAYFLGLANCIVHTILYSYYLLTAYDSKYSKLLWLKKFITQAQLLQFVFLFFMYGQTAFLPDCKFPKIVSFVFIPQNLFMIVLFGDFYIQTYHLAPRRRRKELAEKKKMQELQERREKGSVQENKDL